MKILVRQFLIIFSASLLSQNASAQSVQFFESIQDLPLMVGLEERAGETIVFDKPGGRVVESVVELNGASIDSVQKYYAATLPQFGWTKTAGGIFERGGESLEFIFENDDADDIFRVLLRPQN